MCLSCDCHKPNKRHGDSRNITYLDLKGAAKAAGISVEKAAENILGGTEHAMGKAAGYDVACEVIKSSGDEQRYTLGLAYGANLPDVGTAFDGFQDFVSPAVLEQAAWTYMRKGAAVGLHHADGTEGHGTVVESYIYRGPDWQISLPNGSDYTLKAGQDWLLGVVWDEPTWQAIKAGKLTGYSPQGRARRRRPSAEALAQLRR